MPFDVNQVRLDFPALSVEANGHPLAYLDSAATTQKPVQVLDAVARYNEASHGNPHRGVHYLAVAATQAYEGARERVARFINASPQEVIFTRNATAALNLVAFSYGVANLRPGDEIVLCISEHHSNLVPWQQVARLTGATLKYLYVDEAYRLPWDEVRTKITSNTKITAIAHMSNVLGTIYPVAEIAAWAHRQGAVVVVDAAQSVPHLTVDVESLDADFLVFSGHKVYGPTGIGVLYGRAELLERMAPYQYGGDMIEYVEEQSSTFAPVPQKFEAGTPNVEGAVGLAAALDYVDGLGLESILRHEQELTVYALEELKKLPWVTIYGPQDLSERGPVISFGVEGCHPHDVATIMDSCGVAVRAGHHCAQPLMHYLKIPASSRASFGLYNTPAEVEALVDSIFKVRKWLGYGS
ncbi:MAG TPA: cysteine desulfurase [Firmicutes bacterium]|jgi:cysteine desulfurase/selenocysteine lyase|nr:MAG: cysteine desulfurase [Peptococcaceae bacterium 1109]HHT73544.1 cysteine desulfurase [Bacillota bacterium]